MMTDPKLIITGTFSLYETPDGGFHIAYRPKDADADEHLEFPGHMVKMARRLQGLPGGPAAMFGRLMGGRA